MPWLPSALVQLIWTASTRALTDGNAPLLVRHDPSRGLSLDRFRPAGAGVDTLITVTETTPVLRFATLPATLVGGPDSGTGDAAVVFDPFSGKVSSYVVV